MKSTYKIISLNADNVTVLTGSTTSEDGTEISSSKIFYSTKRSLAIIRTKHSDGRTTISRLNSISFDTLMNMLYSELNTDSKLVAS